MDIISSLGHNYDESVVLDLFKTFHIVYQANPIDMMLDTLCTSVEVAYGGREHGRRKAYATNNILQALCIYHTHFYGQGLEHQDISVDVEKDPVGDDWFRMSSVQMCNEGSVLIVPTHAAAQFVYKYVIHHKKHNQYNGKFIVWDKNMEKRMSYLPSMNTIMLTDDMIFDAQPVRQTNLKTEEQLERISAMRKGELRDPCSAGQKMSLAKFAKELGILAANVPDTWHEKKEFYLSLGRTDSIFDINKMLYQMIDVVVPFDTVNYICGHDYAGNGLSVQDGVCRREIPGLTPMPNALMRIASEHIDASLSLVD